MSLNADLRDNSDDTLFIKEQRNGYWVLRPPVSNKLYTEDDHAGKSNRKNAGPEMLQT
jgi:hypothetical protein